MRSTAKQLSILEGIILSRLRGILRGVRRGTFAAKQQLCALMRGGDIVEITNHGAHVATLVPKGRGIVLSPQAAETLRGMIDLAERRGLPVYSLRKALEEFHG